ncbi:TPA: hypothetical protein ACYLN4_000327 [Burkholderia lata]|uniref:hypothetical protein n=1 Tax=Burkholderiaceae TaxID=119060 RepID=UPI00158C7A7D|nr:MULTISPECIES: hypothetical protein [Burkholderiaceae]MBU7436030.1 hypothetical protein [Paraburkholderia fungorum]UEC01971.1 hypothetical protein LK462_08085 [Burkholderia vietnamiensis]
MFHSFGYRGHTIHIAIPDRSSVEEIKVQLHKPGGGFDLVPCKTLLGAKRRITQHVRRQAGGSS